MHRPDKACSDDRHADITHHNGFSPWDLAPNVSCQGAAVNPGESSLTVLDRHAILEFVFQKTMPGGTSTGPREVCHEWNCGTRPERNGWSAARIPGHRNAEPRPDSDCVLEPRSDARGRDALPPVAGHAGRWLGQRLGLVDQ